MILYNTNADDFGACICWFLQVLYLSFLLAPHWAPERRLKATVTVSFYSSLPNLMEPEPSLMDPLPILIRPPRGLASGLGPGLGLGLPGLLGVTAAAWQSSSLVAPVAPPVFEFAGQAVQPALPVAPL